MSSESVLLPARTPDQTAAARRAMLAIFLVNGAILASWVPHIPGVQRALGLSDGTLGLALLGIAVGAISAMLNAGWLIARFGSRTLTVAAMVAACAGLPLPLLAPNLPLLIGALFLLGACIGLMDVAMNAHAVVVEARYGRPTFSAFHGFFSIGGLLGAGVGALALAAQISPLAHIIGAALIIVIVGLVAARGLLPGDVDERSDGPSFVLPRGPVLALGALAACAMLGEGSMADWSAVYLTNSLGASAGWAGAGFAAYSLAMAGARLTGDRLTGAFGTVALVRTSAALAAAGLGVALLVGQPLAALFGFACVGLGLANVVPALFRAGGTTPGVSAGAGIAAVSTAGYAGFLAGPPLIGFVAEHITLPGALGLVVLVIALIAVCAGVLRQAPG